MEVILLQLKDSAYYYEDNFSYTPYVILKEKDFKEKMKKLNNLIQNPHEFNEVEAFIKNNFKCLNYEKIEIDV